MTDIIDLIDAAIGCGHCGGDLGDSPSFDFCSDECQTTWHAQRADVPEAMPEPDDLPEHVFNLVELHSTETCVDCTEGRWCPDRPTERRAVDLRDAVRVTWPDHRVQLAPVEVAPFALGGLDVPMPLAHFLVEQDGTVRAHGIRDVRINLPAFLRHVTNGRVVGVDPSGDVITRSWLDEASAFTRRLVDAFRAAGEAAAAFAPLADALRCDDPPTDPRARALWQRQRRNTGPRPSHQRAPRTINPRRTR
ncbi:hypothetical protein ACWEFJ_28335 [Actinosynnema sp. NPDC004786]